MRRSTFAIVAALAFALGGCESFDPLDKLQDWDILGASKKPLQGERHAVFPTGVPGVPEGVPPELVKGYQAPAEAPPQVVEEKPKVKPKPKKLAARPKPKAQPQAAQPTQAVQPQQQDRPQAVAPAAAWPAPPQPQQQQTNSSAWPAIPGSQPTWPTQAAPPPAR